MERNTSLLTGLLLNTFGLLVEVEATLGLIQMCLFKKTLTGKKPAKEEEVNSVVTKGINVSAGGSGINLAGLEIWFSGKKKTYVNSMHFYSLLFKKPKKPVASNVINLSAGLLSIKNIDKASVEPMMS
ncbi:hypothetical protein G9A89_007989 [Geosiphon pyriformis]|nr:hypothetical protein G9A89_007989 [Geosiphon pyriformis]